MPITSYRRAIPTIAALAITIPTACASGPPGDPEPIAASEAPTTVEVLRGTDRASVFSPGEAATLLIFVLMPDSFAVNHKTAGDKKPAAEAPAKH